MVETLQQESADLERLASLGYGAQQQAFLQARDALRQIYALSDAPNRPRDWFEQADRTRQDYEQAVRAIQNVPGFEYFLRSLPFQEIQSLAQDAPLVYLAATGYGGFALLVQAAGVEALELPELTEEALQKQVVGFSAKEYRTLVEQAYKENRQPPSPAELLGGYLGAYWRWQAAPRDETAHKAWFDALEAMLAWLGKVVMTSLVERLKSLGVPQGAVVRLIPGGWLGLLPLHAALTPGPSSAGKGEYALDHYTFTYAPSAQALYHAREAAGRPSDTLLAVRYPDPEFQMADQAVQAALSHFAPEGRTPLLMEAAREEAVRQAFGEHAVLFFFTHGQANFHKPLQSGLQMSDGWLTLEDISGLRGQRARLAVLSACETGVSADLQNADEVISLPSGLMLAGVPGVVGTLWSVAESSTTMLISIFFEEWRARGLPAPQALRRAQQILRDARQDQAARRYFRQFLMPSETAREFQEELYIESFAHPFFWAAFTYTGV